MEDMMAPEPQVLESNSEVEVDQQINAEQSNDVQSSESLVPNVNNDVVSTDEVSTAAADGSSSEKSPTGRTEECSEGASLDQVSSSTEPFSGACRDVLPSVNHQMAVIPNMEPYLEDGSLDGTSKEGQDPTSTNGNLTLEDTSNSNPSSNHIDLAESDLQDQNLEENVDRQLDSNETSDLIFSSEEAGNSHSTEEAMKSWTTPEEQVASCSSQLIDESASRMCDDATAISESVVYASEEPLPTSGSSNPDMPTVEVESGVGEAEFEHQFQTPHESNDVHFLAPDHSEPDAIDASQPMVSSLTQAEVAQPEESVSNSHDDCVTVDHPSEELVLHPNNVTEPGCQQLEANEGEGEAAITENDYADSSTLQMEEDQYVNNEPDASMVEQGELQMLAANGDQEPSESIAAMESEQVENVTPAPDVDTVDSSVDHVVQHVDQTPANSVMENGGFEEECAGSGNAVDGATEAEQVDSGIVDSDPVDSRALVGDLVDAGTALMDDGAMEAESLDSAALEGHLVDGGSELMEAEQIDSAVVESEHVDSESAGEAGHVDSAIIDEQLHAVEACPIDREEESASVEGITLDNSGANDQVAYQHAPAAESESIEAQSMDAQLIAEPPVVGNVQAQPVDEGVDSSYYMDQAPLDQPEGTIAEEAEAATETENPTTSHLDQNYQCNEAENSDLVNMDTGMTNPTAVCEADSSAAEMEESGYETQQMMDTQNVYVVEDGRLTLNSVQQSSSMSAYHNTDNTMLVEMAPLSTDGSYVNSQVSYVDAGQDGMITDAQAAELLMRVSEQRPLSLHQTLTTDSSSSSGPYVQVQLEGMTHVVEVPVSALAGYCLPSTLVYSTSGGGNSASGGSEMTTWVQMHESSGNMEQHHHLRTENKFSDIVSASIEAIGFPESSTPGATILSQAEQILIASENTVQESAASASNNFEFDDNSNSSVTVMNDKSTASYPRPKRESIESRIHRLLRGANAPVPEVVEEPSIQIVTTSGRTPQKTVKLTPLQQPNKPAPSPTTQSSSTVTLSLSPNQPKRPGRPVTATTSTGRTVTIPTVFTATNQSANKPPVNALPPGSVDYFMPRGVSKRKAQTFKTSKVNASNPNSIDAEPAPPEETQVKLAMGVDTVDDDDQHKDDDDFNRAVLLQARQRLQSEQGMNHRFAARSSASVFLSLPGGTVKPEEEDMMPAKRVRLSFPPEKYANLESVNPSHMAELQTPKLTYTIPRARQIKPKVNKEAVGIDNLVKQEKEINVRLPWMDEDDDVKRKRAPPRIIRQTPSVESKPKDDVTTFELDPDTEQSEQVIVIGLDETGQQPSEEQLTAIIQAAMTKRESSAPDRPPPAQPTRSLHPVVGTVSAPRVYSKRKMEDENGVETEENGLRPKVIRTYDRGLGIPRKRPPRSKRLSTFLEIFDFEEDEEEEDEEEVDDLERFSQALADEEKAIREKEKFGQKKSPMSSPNNLAGAVGTCSRGRGRGRGRGATSTLRSSPDVASTSTVTPAVRGARSRGRPPRGAKFASRTKIVEEPANNSATNEASSDDEFTFEDDANDDDYKPAARGRGRGRGRGRSRGRRYSGGRPRTISKEESLEAEEEVENVEEAEEEDEDEARIPGMPSKPCPQCDERFTTREGFLEHIVVHSSTKCLVEPCDWTNPVPKEKTRLKQHMLSAHTESIPTARTAATR